MAGGDNHHSVNSWLKCAIPPPGVHQLKFCALCASALQPTAKVLLSIDVSSVVVVVAVKWREEHEYCRVDCCAKNIRDEPIRKSSRMT